MNFVEQKFTCEQYFWNKNIFVIVLVDIYGKFHCYTENLKLSYVTTRKKVLQIRQCYSTQGTLQISFAFLWHLLQETSNCFIFFIADKTQALPSEDIFVSSLLLRQPKIYTIWFPPYKNRHVRSYKILWKPIIILDLISAPVINNCVQANRAYPKSVTKHWTFSFNLNRIFSSRALRPSGVTRCTEYVKDARSIYAEKIYDGEISVDFSTG